MKTQSREIEVQKKNKHTKQSTERTIENFLKERSHNRNYIYNSFQCRSQVDVIYTDFKKAFDSVNHEILILVLRVSGFGEPLLSWFRSYLKDRYQWVKVFGIKSKLFLASSGVPQGGHLSSILFSLFINSVNRVLRHCRFLCFADDIKLLMRICNIEEFLKLQSDYDSFSKWFSELGLSLNLSKCNVFTFSRILSPVVFSYSLGINKISRVLDYVMDPGLKFSYNLDPKPHIEYVCCKAFKTLLRFCYEVGKRLKAKYVCYGIILRSCASAT